MRILVLALCGLSVAACFGEPNSGGADPTWLLGPVPVDSARALEYRAAGRVLDGGPRIRLAEDYDPYRGHYTFGQPLRFERPIEGGIPLVVEYFVSPVDSVVRLVHYDWERRVPPSDDGRLWVREKRAEDRRCPEYDRHFSSVAETLSEHLGSPRSTDEGTRSAESSGERYRYRTATWRSDSVRADVQMICGAGTHRVRARLHWVARPGT